MDRFRRMIGIIGVLLMLVSGMGGTVYAEEGTLDASDPVEAGIPVGESGGESGDGAPDVTDASSGDAEPDGAVSDGAGPSAESTESEAVPGSDDAEADQSLAEPETRAPDAGEASVPPSEASGGAPAGDADKMDQAEESAGDDSGTPEGDAIDPASAGASSIGIQSHEPGPGDFNIDVQGLSVTCATTVSFTAVFTHTGGYTDVIASVMVRLFDNRASWEADTAPVAIIGDSDDRIDLTPGSTTWSETIWAEPQWFGTDSWYVTVSSYLVGYSPDGSIGRVQVSDSWTASVTGCAYDVPPPPSLADASLTCDGLFTHDALGVAGDNLVSYLLYDPATPGFVIDSTTTFPGSPHQFDLHGTQYASLHAVVQDYGQGGEWPTLAEASVTGCLGGEPDPDPSPTGQLALSLSLEDASGNPDTSADGATATWTVAPADAFASGAGVMSFMAVEAGTTYTAVLDGGVASTTTGPLPLGAYEVCLSNVLTGGPEGDVSIGDAPICDTVELTELGATTPVAAGFTATIQNPPTDPGPGDGGTAPMITGLTVDIANPCGFTGGAGTVTGTTQIDGPLDASRYEANLTVGWETPNGEVAWGEAHDGTSQMYWQSEFAVNGPWSMSRSAYDPDIGGYFFGPNRPADATALFARLALSQAGPYEPYDSETISFPLDACGGTEPEPEETAQIELLLSLLDGDGNPDTSADGASATWTVEPLDVVASNLHLMRFMATQAPVSTYSAVVSDGVASTSTDPLALGSYRVCLQPTLTGGPSGDIAIATGPICDEAELTTAGTAPVVAGFVATIQGDTGGDTGDGDSSPADGASESDTPSSETGDPADANDDGVTTQGGATGSGSSAVSGSVSAGMDSRSTVSPSGAVATALPSAGTGMVAGDASPVVWLMLISLLCAAGSLGLRRQFVG